jgi:hypothetical protein
MHSEAGCPVALGALADGGQTPDRFYPAQNIAHRGLRIEVLERGQRGETQLTILRPLGGFDSKQPSHLAASASAAPQKPDGGRPLRPVGAKSDRPRQHIRPNRRRWHRRYIWRDRAPGGALWSAPHLLLAVVLSWRAPGHRPGPHQHRPLLHSGLDLFETGLGAGFVMGTAALSAVCAAEADRTDDIVAGHYR